LAPDRKCNSCERCNKSARVVGFVSCRSKTESVKSLGAGMQQIADWLEQLGISEYTQRFAENRIDLSVFP